MNTTHGPRDAVLSLPEAAEALTCSLRHLHTLIARGDVTAVKSGRRTLIRASAIDRYLSALPVKGVAA